MAVSFHKFGDYFPGTGALEDIGAGEGTGYSVNVPLQEGTDDAMFTYSFDRVMELVFNQYQPEAIILQSGADSLSGDRLGCFNLTLRGHSHAVRTLKSKGVPLLVLGGGGYTLRNVSKCWAYETACILGTELEHRVPDSAEYFGYYAPDYLVAVRPSNMDNQNDKTQLEDTLRRIEENFRGHVRPLCGTEVPRAAEADEQCGDFVMTADKTQEIFPDRNFDTQS
eukprot:Polyplicarium_translucidae@DN2412_c0_g1_i2.p1